MCVFVRPALFASLVRVAHVENEDKMCTQRKTRTLQRLLLKLIFDSRQENSNQGGGSCLKINLPRENQTKRTKCFGKMR